MSNFTVKQIVIGDKIMDEITDEDNNKWYPLKYFLKIVLRKEDKVSSFRDSAMIRYMKVFEYESPRHGFQRPIKTWCINELGIKYLLRKMKINKVNNRYIYRARQKGFYEACLYFKVRPYEDLDPSYINVPPKLDDYDIWSLLCIQNDSSLRINSTWKKCPKCNYFYPNTSRYYGAKQKKETPCLQCQNKNFKCKNKIIQYIYEHGGLDLLYKLYMNNDSNSIVEELKIFINKDR